MSVLVVSSSAVRWCFEVVKVLSSWENCYKPRGYVEIWFCIGKTCLNLCSTSASGLGHAYFSLYTCVIIIIVMQNK